MTLREQYVIKRMALNMSQEEFASIADVSVGTYSRWEKGEIVERWEHYKIKDSIENYIRSFPREKYLQTSIREETLLLEHETEEEHIKTLSHMMIHISKLQMMYVSPLEA